MHVALVSTSVQYLHVHQQLSPQKKGKKGISYQMDGSNSVKSSLVQ